MSVQCPTCSKVNPANAAYCYYDGRPLNQTGQKAPLGLGTLPFPLPFSFSDGLGCANYNQLALACDRRWNEARSYLVNRTWERFFSTIGRIDLATLAAQSAKETDPDVGLCYLLEGLPADAEALRPPKLALTSTAEDLGALEPGKDHKLEVVIENQGMLMLRGSVMTDCDWLFFGDRQGNASAKLFQTRDTYSLSVRVVGNRLRAGKKPLEGQIVIDTNGGCQTIAVRATVPIRPFPRGQVANNVLAGATSPRDVAVKAREHPKEAAPLFEQGAVKAWYERNGWTYPVQGSQARGKGAVQQFFEALGLTKPPRLEIDTERINCQGEVGQRLTKKVIIRTAEAKFVNAEARSNQRWLKVLPAKSQGNSVTIPLLIQIPPRRGETLQATVTFQGNGQQQFIVPVTLTVAGLTPEQEEKRERRGRRLEWIAGGVGVLLFVAIAVVIVLGIRRQHADPVPTSDKTALSSEKEKSKVVAWWDTIPNNNLTQSVTTLKEVAGDKYRPIFDALEGGSVSERGKAYEQLAAELPELARNPEAKEPLGLFVTECCVHEADESNITPLVQSLARQLPAEEPAFAADDKGAEEKHVSFWLGVARDAVAHKAAGRDRKRYLADKLNTVVGPVLGTALDLDAPPDELNEQVEKLLAEQCYHNTLPVARKSIEQALAIREDLIAAFPRHLTREVREQDDLKLLAYGLPRGNSLWPKLEPLFKTCVESNEINIGSKLMDLYERANLELTPKMEALLAARWKIAGKPELPRANKVAAIRNRMATHARAAQIPRAERVTQFEGLLEKSPPSPRKPGGPREIVSLRDTVRLAHASTMACLLFSKDAEPGRFDELIAQIPGMEQGKPANKGKKPDEKPQQSEGIQVIDVRAGLQSVQGDLTTECQKDPHQQTYYKKYWVRTKSLEVYDIQMQSDTLDPYIRVEVSQNKKFDAHGPNASFWFLCPAEGDYILVASCTVKDAVGHFTLQVSPRQANGFGAQRFSSEAQGAVEKKAVPWNKSDLAALGDRQSHVRILAFKNLAGSVPNDLRYSDAKTMASYLLLPPEWEDPELEAVTGQLPSLARSRRLLEALADVIAKRDSLAQKRTEAVVGGLLKLPRLHVAEDENWQSACRKLLLQRALKLTVRTTTATNVADKAADSLRDLYKEQGPAFGLEDLDFDEQTQLTPVLERLIKHVADKAAQQELAKADKTYLEQIDRRLQATRLVAENDLEHVVLLQRIWIKVLILALPLQGEMPAQAQKTMTEVREDLGQKDLASGDLLDQLRSGEENIRQVWALALELKLK